MPPDLSATDMTQFPAKVQWLGLCKPFGRRELAVLPHKGFRQPNAGLIRPEPVP